MSTLIQSELQLRLDIVVPGLTRVLTLLTEQSVKHLCLNGQIPALFLQDDVQGSLDS